MTPGDPHWAACNSGSGIGLQDDEVHLWRLDLNRNKAVLTWMKEVLNQEELFRSKRFKSKEDSESYTASHAVLREILAGYTGIEPKKLVFVAGRNNKPELKGEVAGSGKIHFNISHSIGITLIAVAKNRRVGIDVERIDEEFPCQEVANHFFSKEEVRYLESYDATERLDIFFRIWTWKEAYLKAVGYGISEAQKTPVLLPDLSHISIALNQKSIRDSNATEWRAIEIGLGKMYRSCLVVEGSSIRLRLFSWSNRQRKN